MAREASSASAMASSSLMRFTITVRRSEVVPLPSQYRLPGTGIPHVSTVASGRR